MGSGCHARSVVVSGDRRRATGDRYGLAGMVVTVPSEAPEDAAAEGHDELAGTLAVVVAVVGVVVGATLAGPIGRLLQPEPLDFWPEVAEGTLIAPEPAELVRWAIAVAVPLLIATVLLLVGHGGRRLPLRIPLAGAGSAAAALGIAMLVAGWVARAEPATYAYGLHPSYFTTGDALVALAVAGLLAAAALHPSLRPRLARRTAPSGGPHGWRRAALWTGAVLVTALFVVPAVYTDANVADAPPIVSGHLPFTFADFGAFANGATPLGDFAAQYSNVLPWLLHPVFTIAGCSGGAFTAVMGALSLVALLAVWRVLVLAVGSEVVGTALYLPVLALSLRATLELGDERMTNASLVQILPERYVLPFAVAWLCLRHLRGRRPHAPMVVFLAGGLALLNNPELGGPSLVAACVALVLGSHDPPGAAVRRCGAALAAGVAVAVAVVGTAVWVRSGVPPDPGLLTYFSRLFAAHGFGLQPMPALGLHLVLYVTFAGSLLLGAARRRAGDGDGPLLAALGFAGTFGLGASGYYAGRSNAITMVALFPAWGLAVALLAWWTIRWLLAGDGRRRLLRPTAVLALSTLVGLGLAASDLLHPPAPWTQARRLADESEAGSVWFDLEADEQLVASHTEPGEPVLILRANGHLVARGAGVRNVSHLGHPFNLVAESQLQRLLDDLAAEGGTTVFVGGGPSRSVRCALGARGWRPAADAPTSSLSAWRQVGAPAPSSGATGGPCQEASSGRKNISHWIRSGSLKVRTEP
jgi:hypothetical protein